MTRCAVRGCKSGTFSNSVVNVQNNIRPPTLFTVPKSPTAIAKWEAALNQSLPPKSRVCELHFAYADVKRSDDTLMPDGSIFSLPRQKYSLCKTAIPKDLVNQENKAPGIKSEPILLETEKMAIVQKMTETDTSLSDHQYYIDANKPGQYCYYNKKVAACFTIPSLNDDLQKMSKNVDKTCTKTDQECSKNQVMETKNLSPDKDEKCSSPMSSQEDSLTIESIVDYLQKKPIRRSWSWMKFTKKDMGITFAQIHFRTRKVRCYVELYEDLSVSILTGDEQISLEIVLEITSIEHILDLLATVEKMKICTGTGYEHGSRDKNCNGIISADEEYKIAILCDRCVVCRGFRKQLRLQKKYPRVDMKIKYAKVKKELDVLRRRCKYYEGRLSLKNKRLKIIKAMIQSHNKNNKTTTYSNGKNC